MVGLGVRDAGIAASDGAREPAPGLPRLRVDIPLAARHAWTVEPGLYFVAPLLARERGRRDVDWDRVDGLLGFGGVRIEHNVLVTDGGCEVLTAAVPL
jgi:Xaa-Pro aminopeptidase